MIKKELDNELEDWTLQNPDHPDWPNSDSGTSLGWLTVGIAHLMGLVWGTNKSAERAERSRVCFLF